MSKEMQNKLRQIADLNDAELAKVVGGAGQDVGASSVSVLSTAKNGASYSAFIRA